MDWISKGIDIRQILDFSTGGSFCILECTIIPQSDLKGLMGPLTKLPAKYCCHHFFFSPTQGPWKKCIHLGAGERKRQQLAPHSWAELYWCCRSASLGPSQQEFKPHSHLPISSMVSFLTGKTLYSLHFDSLHSKKEFPGPWGWQKGKVATAVHSCKSWKLSCDWLFCLCAFDWRPVVDCPWLLYLNCWGIHTSALRNSCGFVSQLHIHSGIFLNAS